MLAVLATMLQGKTWVKCQHNVVDDMIDTVAKDRKGVSVQTMVSFNSSHDTACPKIKLRYNITTGCFQSRPPFERKNKT